MHVAADELELRVAHQDAGQQARLAEDLKTIADAHHQTAGGGMGTDRIHHRRTRRNRSAAQIVAIGKAARHHHQVGAFR